MGLVGGVASVLTGGLLVFSQVGPVATGYVAKIACSAVFVSGRSMESVRAEDVAGYDYVSASVDMELGGVVAHILGLARSKAVFRPGLGCTLAHQHDAASLRAQVIRPPVRSRPASPLPDSVEPKEAAALGVDPRLLADALDFAFREPNPMRPRRTRAVLVLYKGRMVAEGYREGLGPDTPLLGWSMTKSVLATLVGRALELGLIGTIDQPVLAPEWSDERAEIRWRHLLQMASGLEFEERYGAFADATDMLFRSADTGRFGLKQPLLHPPGEHFSYSSGTTNALSLILRRALGDDRYHRLPAEELFHRLGLERAVLEPDASGTFVGSSFMYATARDWARLGQLYLLDGVWYGERLLPEGWVSFVRSPAPDSGGAYGGHFWLNQGGELPSVPKDAFSMRGYEGQSVVIVPSREAVVVRLGQTPPGGDWDLDGFLARVLAALPAGEGPSAAKTSQPIETSMQARPPR